jgi:hypothetical protein
MCFLNEYSCTVRCLNTDLNVSAAVNGTIQSLRPAGDQCRVMACEFVGQIGDGPAATGSGATLLHGSFWPSFLIGAGLMLMILGFIGIWMIRHKKEDPLGPPIKDKKDRDL